MDMERLWRENRRLCCFFARRMRWICERDPAVTVDDLVGEAFIAICHAAETYDPTGGKTWAGWASWAVTAALQSAARSARRHGVSLDEPISDDDESESRLDQIEDPGAERSFDAVIDEEARKAVEEALQRLSDGLERETVHLCYIDGETLKSASERLCVDAGTLRAAKDRALRKLRNDRKLRQALWDELPSYGTGLCAFRSRGSATERAAIWLAERTV